MKRSRDVEIDENVDFETLVQSKQLVRGLAEAGYERPSPIQLQAIPLGRLGIDLIAQAKSGTGKTVVFSVIALESIRSDVNKPQVLVIAPTREIAVQIRDVLRNIGRHMQGFQCEAFIGGLSIRADAKKAPKCQVVIGTPGRLIQLMTEKILDTSEIRLLVLDEADRLMSETFTKQIQYVYRRLPKRKQCIAFSATFSDDLLKLLDTLMDKPQTVRLTTKVPELEEVQQYYKSIRVGEIENPFKRKLTEYKAKFEAAAEILGKIPFHQCMIFINSVPRAMELSKWLTEMGWMSGYISGGLSQEQRLDVLCVLITMASLSIVAPCPKKPSSPVYSPLSTTTTTTTTATTNPPTTICHDDDDACQELRQILTAHQQYYNQEEIARTGNPLPQDSSFIVPLHHLQVTETTKIRPRSYSVGDRNHFVANMVH